MTTHLHFNSSNFINHTSKNQNTCNSKVSQSSIGCFRKWRSILKVTNEALKQNVPIDNKVQLPKAAPKSLPLSRRSNNLPYKTLVHNNFISTNKFRKISYCAAEIESATAASSSTISINSDIPPEIPLRLNSNNPHNNSIVTNFHQLKKVSWYWGPLSFAEAESLLANKKNGTFLVRDSGHESFVLSVSVRAQGSTCHTRFTYSNGKFILGLYGEKTIPSSNIIEIIELLMKEAINGSCRYLIDQEQQQQHREHYPLPILSNHQSVEYLPQFPLATSAATTTTIATTNTSSTSTSTTIPIYLRYPMSRNKYYVPSLQHLARFQILLNIRRDHIAHLDLTHHLIQYLNANQYFIESFQPYLVNE